MVCSRLQGHSPAHLHHQASLKLTPLLTFRISSSHGISWHPRTSVSPIVRRRDLQGYTVTSPQEVGCCCHLLQLPCSLPPQIGYPHHRLAPASSSFIRSRRPGRQLHISLTLVTPQLSQFHGCCASARHPRAVLCPLRLQLSPCANQSAITHVSVPKHHLHCLHLANLITSKPSTTFPPPKPPSLLMSR